MTTWGPPARAMLDTNVINTLLDEGEYIFHGYAGERDEALIDPELVALRVVIEQARRQKFQLVTSPLSVAEVVNIPSADERIRRLGWFLEMLDYWNVELDGTGDRHADGGTVRHRFKLAQNFQELELALMAIADLRRDPFDRLLLIHTRMANCDVFLTEDRNSLWRHRRQLAALGIVVVTPSEYLPMIAPYAAL